MRIENTDRITVIGAGMSGALLSLMLARRGFDVVLFEAGTDPRKGSPDAWGSSSLSLGERGRHALTYAGLLEEVDAITKPMVGRMIHDRSRRTTLQPYGVEASEVLYAAPRQRLLNCLLDAAETTGRVRLHFGHRLLDVDWQASAAAFRTEGHDAGGDRMVHAFEVIIGADGARSALRRAMSGTKDLDVSEELLDAGFKPFSIPALPGGEPPLDPTALHVWPRGGYMMIALPAEAGRFSAILFLPISGDHRMLWGFEQLDSHIRRRAFMQANFPDAADLMPDLDREFNEQPVRRMGTVRCRHWHLGGRALLIGDAAHTVAPFHGQGVNSAFEDCETLLRLLEDSPDWESAFRSLQDCRKPDTDALAEMSLDAFRTIRDSVRHRDFLLRKALERELERRHHDRFMARYALVSFRRIPYAEALDRGRVQAGILDDLLQGKRELTEVDLERAARLVEERLEPLAVE
ncbi:MAG: NAD(P)/FAD-dependent oxidoreductase [Lysobacterales bacterium]|jgi:kynurenine 3-monooxygenase